MLSIFITILPVFLIAGIGYLSAKTGYLSVELSKHLNTFTIRLAIPVLVFNAIHNLDFNKAYNVPMLLGYYIGGLTCFVVGVFLAKKIWKRSNSESVAVGFCALFSNTVLMGLPIIERAYGVDALAPVFAIISLHVIILYSIGMVAMEIARREKDSNLSSAFLKAGKSIIANPLMWGAMSGIIFNVLNIPIAEPIEAALKLIAATGLPAALIALGISLTQYKIKAEFSESLMVASLSLFLQPIVALIIAHYIFNAPPELARTAVLVGAMPPGMNIYIFATMYKKAENLAASALLISTILSIFTISFWLWLLPQIGL